MKPLVNLIYSLDIGLLGNYYICTKCMIWSTSCAPCSRSLKAGHFIDFASFVEMYFKLGYHSVKTHTERCSVLGTLSLMIKLVLM